MKEAAASLQPKLTAAQCCFPRRCAKRTERVLLAARCPDDVDASERRGRAVGHLAIYERDIKIGKEALRVGLLGEIAIAADRRGAGLARRLVREAHEDLRARSIPFSILFAFEPCLYVSSGYKLMQNHTRFIDADGHWKTLVYHGSM
jgi:predicted acetyltransferase